MIPELYICLRCEQRSIEQEAADAGVSYMALQLHMMESKHTSAYSGYIIIRGALASAYPLPGNSCPIAVRSRHYERSSALTADISGNDQQAEHRASRHRDLVTFENEISGPAM